jgi:hypothetical protein
VERGRLRFRFALDSHALATSALGPGIVQRSPDQPSYLHGVAVTLTAVSDSACSFIGWSGDASGTENPLVVTMDAARSIVAHFADQGAPLVEVLAPNGGETLAPGATFSIQWMAWDNRAVASVDILLSRNGVTGPFETLAAGEAPDGAFSWVVTGPATPNALIRVAARDSAGNLAQDESNDAWTIGGGQVVTPDAHVTEFSLAPVVPNPTRGSFTIEYSVARDARVRLAIVDLQGRQIATLVDDVLHAGRYRVSWGQRAQALLAPGTYFVRYQAGGQRRVRRFTVAR